MAQDTYKEAYTKTKDGQLFIVISEALRLGKEHKYKDVVLKGAAKLFPDKFITDKVENFIKPKVGILWTDKDMFNEEELIKQAKKAQSEIVKEEYGLESAKLLENVIYNRKEKVQIGTPREELTDEEALAKGKKLEKVSIKKKEVVEEKEYQDTSEMEEFSFEKD